MEMPTGCNRREFVKAVGAASAAAAGGLVLAGPGFGQTPQAAPVETNIADFVKVPRTARSLPGPFPGKVVKVTDSRSVIVDKPPRAASRAGAHQPPGRRRRKPAARPEAPPARFDAKVVEEMVAKGITTLTGKSMKESFALLVDPRDVVGIKVNPVGPLPDQHPPGSRGRRHQVAGRERHPEVEHRHLGTRFDYMLKDAGFTKERFPGIALEGLQTMDEEGNKWRGADGNHVSIDNFDRDAFYFAKGVVGKGVKGYKDDEFYLNQHVFNGEYSYFGKLLTRRVTRIINVAAYKNTGASISMATKNMGYGSVCNTGRLHAPLSLKSQHRSARFAGAPRQARAEHHRRAAGAVRRRPGQERAVRVRQLRALLRHRPVRHSTCSATRRSTPSARKWTRRVNESPRITEYLRYAESLGLGVVSPEKMNVVKV